MCSEQGRHVGNCGLWDVIYDFRVQWLSFKWVNLGYTSFFCDVCRNIKRVTYCNNMLCSLPSSVVQAYGSSTLSFYFILSFLIYFLQSQELQVTFHSSILVMG